MAVYEELETLKKSLSENIAKSDFVGFRRNVQLFQKKFEDILEPEDKIELQKLAETMNRSRATYYEFVLFLIVLAFLVLIFGERNEIMKEIMPRHFEY